jgi:hypothetical protein
LGAGEKTRTLLVAACLLAALASPSGAAEQIALPDEDPFYAQDRPEVLRAHPPGTVLRSREVALGGAGVPILGRAWQLAYRSNDSKGRAITAVATLVVPLTPYQGKRPLVSYQMAIDALGTQCNPSYTMRTGTQKEMPSVVRLLDAGWAVVVPDFEGPRMAYTAGLVAAHHARRHPGVAAVRARRAGGGAGRAVGLLGRGPGDRVGGRAAARLRP